jgi:hypothetical protein
LSYDGRYVAFQYWSSSGPYFYGALIRDRQTGTDRAASLSSCGVSAWIPTGLYLGGSISTSVSGDGQRMLFNSPAMNLAAGDLNGKEDVFLRDFLAPASGPACSYCRPGTSSIGCVPSMSTSGIPSASSGAGFTLSCTNVQGQTYGILFMGLAPQLAPGGGPGSHFCVAVSARLTPPTNTSGTFNTCDGFLSIDWNAAVGSTLPPGEEVFAQAWLRDPGATSTVLSDAVQFYVRP